MIFKLIKILFFPEKEKTTISEGNGDHWCVIANVKKEIPYGPGGHEIKSGLKKFKAGAKLHIVGAYFGPADSLVAIGQHRKTNKYIRCVIKANAIEKLRVKKIYSKRILEMIEYFQEQNNGAYNITKTKERAQELAYVIPKWAKYIDKA